MSWFGGGQVNMEDQLFNLRFSAKQFEKMSKKSEKESQAIKEKVKKAIQSGNIEGARIYSENAIRKKNEANNFLRMASRLDAVSQRVQTAMTMKNVTKDMGNLVKGMDSVMKTMDLEKISLVMDKFESQFQNLDVHTQVMENSMGAATSLSMPEDQVDALIQQVGEEHGLEVAGMLEQAKPGQDSLRSTQTAADKADEELVRKLARLREAT